jgi:NitT/TauT family transport system substrate-binding protein
MLVHMLESPDATPDKDSVNLLYYEDAFTAGDAFLKDVKAKGKLAGCVTWEPKTSEVVEKSNGKAYEMAANDNILIIADILIVNRGFAEQNPKMVAGLVEGLLEGNRLVTEQTDAQLDTIGKAFKWDQGRTRAELAKVHLSNLPENQAFFSGSIDSAGSYGGIFQSAIYAYGKELIKDPPEPERFLDLSYLTTIQTAGTYADQKILISPIKKNKGGDIENNPLLTKDIRFYFEPNSAKLDLNNAENLTNLGSIKELLQISPGSTILLRGHVDDAMVPQFRKQGGESFVREMALQAVELSKQRAEEIKTQVVAKYSIDVARIKTTGRGWEEPVSKDSALNRRVEVQWFMVE